MIGRPKEEVRRLLDTLPEESSLEDIQYHIYVQQAIRRGLEASARDELVEQDEIEKRMSKWLGEEGGRSRPGTISNGRQRTSRTGLSSVCRGVDSRRA